MIEFCLKWVSYKFIFAKYELIMKGQIHYFLSAVWLYRWQCQSNPHFSPD